MYADNLDKPRMLSVDVDRISYFFVKYRGTLYINCRKAPPLRRPIFQQISTVKGLSTHLWYDFG